MPCSTCTITRALLLGDPEEALVFPIRAGARLELLQPMF